MESTGERRRLVGRQSALAAVRSAADAAAAGHGQLILVTGEPGIGKTAVLAEAAGDAADAGALVVWGQCWDGDGAPVYWPWVQVLRAGIAAGVDAGDAVMVLPEHTGTGSPAASDPLSASATADARFQLFDAVVSFLAQLAKQQPLLVVLDDLHWADEGSLGLVEFASRHMSAQPILLLGAYRDEEASPRLRQLAAMNEQVSLAGLSRADVAALMAVVTGTPPAAPMSADVWRRTGGNPFLVRELTRLLVAQGATHETPPPRQLLASVGDILERRLARLSQPCVDLLTLAAVVGPEVRLEVMVKLSDAADAVPELLDEAVAARVLLRPAAPVGPYRFSHGLFRETILSGLSAARRAQLHLAAGRALESLQREGGSVHSAELAAHFSAAITAAPVEAVRYAMLAAEDATSRLAFEEARGHYERAMAAVQLWEEPASTDRLEVLLRLADARHRVGATTEAHRAYRDAAGLARRLGDATALARAAIGVHTLGWRIVHTEAIGLLEDAVGSLPEAPSALRSRVLAALARDLHHAHDEQQDWQRALVLADEAVTIARKLQDPGTLAFALLALHDARWRPGTAADRLSLIDEMLAASDDADDRDLWAQARLLRATALIELGDPKGPADLEAYCRYSEELGHARARYGALSRRATATLIAGDLTRAEQLAEEAFALGRTIGEPDARGVYETLMWAVSYAGGAWRTGTDDADLRLGSEPWPGLPLLDAVVQVADGQLAAARRALGRLHLDDLPQTYDLEMLAFAAQAVAAAGTDQQRGDLYDLLLPFAGGHVVAGGCASYFGAVDHHLGLLARSLAHVDDAHRHFTAAAALHDRLGAPAMAARSRAEAEGCRVPRSEHPSVFHRDGDVWTLSYRGSESHLPDSKGLHDLAALLARPGESVHAVELHTGRPPHTGADDVLDDRAKAAYRRRLAELDSDIDEAEAANDSYRAERAHDERDALIAELSAAVGLGGRDRRLGDERERARKAVTARIRDAIARIARADPELGQHLHDAVRTGTWCAYTPPEPIRWHH